MCKIRFKIEVWETTVVLLIFEQNEDSTASDDRDSYTYEPTDSRLFNVSSSSCPEFSDSSDLDDDDNEGDRSVATIYIRGDNEDHHFKTCSKHLLSTQEAHKYKQKVIDSIYDWALNWEGHVHLPTVFNQIGSTYEF